MTPVPVGDLDTSGEMVAPSTRMVDDVEPSPWIVLLAGRDLGESYPHATGG